MISSTVVSLTFHFKYAIFQLRDHTCLPVANSHPKPQTNKQTNKQLNSEENYFSKAYRLILCLLFICTMIKTIY